MQILHIPLSQLKLSPLNARRTADDVDDLAASIKAHGLRQNLNVQPADGIFHVVAGGRRLRALQLLEKSGELPPELEEVPCLVVEPGTVDAGEISLAENVVRHAMHPADEFVAYNELATRAVDPLTPDQIAARYGVPEIHVRRRLKLARVAPSIIQLYREDQATLEQLEALAITDDTAAQEVVWKSLKEWQRNPHNLRKLLTKEDVEADDSIAKYVGLQAYRAAGGATREDLFANQGDTGIYLTDAKLVRDLAEQKLNKRADQLLREGWSWAEVRMEFGFEAKRKFGHLEQAYIGGKKQPWTDAQKAAAGCVVTIQEYGHGKAEVHYGLVRPEDKKKAAAAARGATAADVAETPSAPKPKKANDQLPMSSVLRLQGLRTAVLRLHLANNPHMALAALAASLWGPGTANTPDGAVGLVAKNDWAHRPERAVEDAIDEHANTKELEKKVEAMQAQVPSKGSVFEWLLGQPIEKSIEMITTFVAGDLLLAQRAEHKGKPDEGRAFLGLAGVDFTKHWQVSAEWLAEQPTAYVLKLVQGLCGKRAAVDLSKVKGKANIAARACELILAADPEWLPEPLLPPKPKKATTKRGAAA